MFDERPFVEWLAICAEAMRDGARDVVPVGAACLLCRDIDRRSHESRSVAPVCRRTASSHPLDRIVVALTRHARIAC
jgi:hypothetical protein